MPHPPSRGGQELKKKQTTEHYKAGFQTPQKLFVCCSVVITVER